MAKDKFIYNTQTLRYEKVVEPLNQRIFKFLGFLVATFFFGFILMMISHKYFPSPREKRQAEENKQLRYYFKEINGVMDEALLALENIQSRDATAHRMIFGMNPVDEGIWEGGIGGHKKYEELKSFSSSDLIRKTLDKQEALKRKIAIQSQSLDTILEKAREKENMLASVPSIKPIREDQLNRSIRYLSGFGFRFHPIHKMRKFHKGVDFPAPKGTPILATGNGKVIKVEYKKYGFGRNIVIDHGFGYKTRYAHMDKIDVSIGDKVVKGQQIGTVGSTGTSTAPHCHYEIIFKDKQINPIHYCMDGLTPEEYQAMADAAATMNQSFD